MPTISNPSEPTLAEIKRSRAAYLRLWKAGKGGHWGAKLSKAYSTYTRTGKENQDKIAAITSAAPGNVCAQMLAAKKIKSMSADQLRYYTRTLASMEGINPGDGKQGGFDYFATIEAKAEADAVAQASMVSDLKELVRAAKDAANNPAAAKMVGIDVPDPEATKARIEEIEENIAELENPERLTFNRPLPKDKRAAFMGVIEKLADAGINTPEALVKGLEERVGGKLRPYTQSIWNGLTMFDEVAAQNPSPDWAQIYSEIEESQSAPADKGDSVVTEKVETVDEQIT